MWENPHGGRGYPKKNRKNRHTTPQVHKNYHKKMLTNPHMNATIQVPVQERELRLGAGR